MTSGATSRAVGPDACDGREPVYAEAALVPCATKLASELLITEYVETFGLRAYVNRCGVLAGQWQMGRVDQGIVTHWVLSHVLGRPLTYIGFGGGGLQVRDLLHVDDLADLIDTQLTRLSDARGQAFNVGGGVPISASLVGPSSLSRRQSHSVFVMTNVHFDGGIGIRSVDPTGSAAKDAA